MIRVLAVDDHLAVRAGLERLFRGEPGFVLIGLARTAEEAIRHAQRDEPDVAVVDHQLPDGDGLAVCRRLKELCPAPGVLIYSAFAEHDLTVPALLAGADGLLDKGASADELFEAIRAVRRGRSAFPILLREQVASSAERLPPEDLPILGMMVDRTPLAEVAAVLRIAQPRLEARIEKMIQRLA